MTVTLAQIESELARRTGPYEAHAVTSGGPTVAVVAELISTLDTGEYEDRWLLRRGVLPRDRARRIASYDAATGTLAVERAWASTPSPGEVIEVVALDPTQHLRQAVRMGLSRCFFEDRVTIPSTDPAAERDLTDARAWLTRPAQLRAIEMLPSGATAFPSPLAWWDWFQAGGHLRLKAAPDPAPAQVYVTALRPHDSWVNGADSTTGPVDDDDALAVDLEYAVVAAHKYAHEAFGDRLTGYGKTADEVDRGWRVQIRGHVRPPPDRLQLGYPYAGVGAGAGELGPGSSWALASSATWRGLSALTWRAVWGG